MGESVSPSEKVESLRLMATREIGTGSEGHNHHINECFEIEHGDFDSDLDLDLGPQGTQAYLDVVKSNFLPKPRKVRVGKVWAKAPASFTVRRSRDHGQLVLLFSVQLPMHFLPTLDSLLLLRVFIWSNGDTLTVPC